MSRELPQEIERKLARAARLEWWTIFWLVTIIVVMYLAMGSSQAMKSAWIEDTLSLAPPLLFLLARRFESKPATAAYPYGFERVGSLAFFLAAAALTAVGGFLVYDAASVLLTQEHPTIGNVTILGHDVWLGWLMIAALGYSIIPPVILGRMKKPLAEAAVDKILYTDADMNAADWQTGAAGILGILGIAFGLWWADAAAAGAISIAILWDGIRNIRIAVAELLDGAPRQLSSTGIHPAVTELTEMLERQYPRHRIEIRETGRYMRVNMVPEGHARPRPEVAEQLAGEHGWRLLAVGRVLEDPLGREAPKDAPREG